MTTPSTSNNKSQLPSALIANLQGVLAGRKDSAAGDGNGHIGEKNDCGDEETPVPSSGVGSASSPKGSKPIVLLTNSDGIGSPGLTLLVEALVRDGQYDIYVCAPESFYSGSVAGAREAVMSGIPSISVSLIW
ncbi:5'-nucleotidase [Apostasia shenzhenica]|uniref:5'-nucleotidase n=1 Tax=Apostasia shenzhenica TaxID=1088818 RepID=A0A2I0A6T0_9ASPA|nr:5'-nucleotidase [Apostasia shenzhenica]